MMNAISSLIMNVRNVKLYEETKIHMNAYRQSKTTTKKVVVVEQEK